MMATHQINIDNAKPVSAKTETDNTLQDLNNQ